MSHIRKLDPAEFVVAIEKMSDDELFGLMAEMEKASEQNASNLDGELQSRMILTETAIESRFPGQLLAPFKQWKDDRLLG